MPKKELATLKMTKKDISAEMIYDYYRLSKLNMKKFFDNLQIMDYILLYYLEENENEKVFLKEISESLELSMPELSPLISELSEKQYVIWTHDDSYNGGTYVILTERGREALSKQEDALADGFSAMIDRFGQDRFREMLLMMHQMVELFHEQLDK